MVSKLVDSLLTIIAGTLANVACAAAVDVLDPVGAEARADLTDDRIAAFLDSATSAGVVEDAEEPQES